MSTPRPDIEEAIEKLITFASLHNVSVTVDPAVEDMFYPYQNKIYISQRKEDPELTLFYLLHEIGHLITHLNADEWRRQNLKYTSSMEVDDAADSCKAWYQIANLSEEHDAWRNGKILAHQLKLKFNLERYEDEWVDAMRDYVEYAYRHMFND